MNQFSAFHFPLSALSFLGGEAHGDTMDWIGDSDKIYHTVNRLRSFLSPSHSVTRSLGHSVTRSLGHLITRSLSHSVLQSSNHHSSNHLSSCLPVFLSSCHLVIKSSRHPFIQSSSNHDHFQCCDERTHTRTTSGSPGLLRRQKYAKKDHR